MTRTLLVNCYRRESEQKMPYYRRLCARYSDEVREVAVGDLVPGFDLAGVTGIVISGSQRMLAEEPVGGPLAEFCRRLELPTLGICFGHQLLASSFGAEVRSGPRFLEFDETIEVLEPWSLFDGLGPKTSMRESHREYVTPESVDRIGWQLGARSVSCPVEAIRHPRLALYGVQFHPERSGATGERLFANFFNRVTGRVEAG